jgi:flagellar FliJ protein
VREADAASVQAREQRERFEVRLVAARQQPLRASEQIAFFQSYQDEVLRERKALEVLASARKEMDRQRGLWIAARRDVRVIENLKVKARETHRLECEREEQSAMDDRTNAMAHHAPLLTS